MSKDYNIGIKVIISLSEGTISTVFLLPTTLDAHSSNLEIEKMKTFYMNSFDHLIEEIKAILSQKSIKEDQSYSFFFKASLDWKQREKLIRGFLESIIKEEGDTSVTYH